MSRSSAASVPRALSAPPTQLPSNPIAQPPTSAVSLPTTIAVSPSSGDFLRSVGRHPALPAALMAAALMASIVWRANQIQSSQKPAAASAPPTNASSIPQTANTPEDDSTAQRSLSPVISAPTATQDITNVKTDQPNPVVAPVTVPRSSPSPASEASPLSPASLLPRPQSASQLSPPLSSGRHSPSPTSQGIPISSPKLPLSTSERSLSTGAKSSSPQSPSSPGHVDTPTSTTRRRGAHVIKSVPVSLRTAE